MINKFKKKLENGLVTFGPFVGYPSPAIVELMGWMEFDFVIIDCEHGPMDFETTEIVLLQEGLLNPTSLSFSYSYIY